MKKLHNYAEYFWAPNEESIEDVHKNAGLEWEIFKMFLVPDPKNTGKEYYRIIFRCLD